MHRRNSSGTSIRRKSSGTGTTLGPIVSRFTEFITNKLLSVVLMPWYYDVNPDNIDVVWVRGLLKCSDSTAHGTEGYDGNLPGCGNSRPHRISSMCRLRTKGIAGRLADCNPGIYGVITADTIEQVIERAGTKAGNKGVDAALTAIEMANLLKQL